MDQVIEDAYRLDITWKNPSRAQAAAFAIALKMKPRHVTEFEAAEFMCMAHLSLWYTQAKRWAEAPPEIGEAKVVWQRACKFIVDVVNLGWNETDGWWPLAKLGQERVRLDTVVLMDFKVMLDQYRQRSLAVVSRGFDLFIDVMCGRGWERRYKQLVKKMSTKGE